MPYQGLRMYHKVDKSSNIEAEKETKKKKMLLVIKLCCRRNSTSRCDFIPPCEVRLLSAKSLLLLDADPGSDR